MTLRWFLICSSVICLAAAGVSEYVLKEPGSVLGGLVGCALFVWVAVLDEMRTETDQ